MPRNEYAPLDRDPHAYVGRFRGFRMVAFGREQILDYEAEITVYQLRHHPPMWVAMDERSKSDPRFDSHTAEDTMRLVEEAFTVRLSWWQPFIRRGLSGPRKLGPQLVQKSESKAS